MVRVV